MVFCHHIDTAHDDFASFPLYKHQLIFTRYNHAPCNHYYRQGDLFLHFQTLWSFLQICDQWKCIFGFQFIANLLSLPHFHSIILFGWKRKKKNTKNDENSYIQYLWIRHESVHSLVYLTWAHLMLDEFQLMSGQSVLAHFLVHVNYNTPEMFTMKLSTIWYLS